MIDKKLDKIFISASLAKKSAKENRARTEKMRKKLAKMFADGLLESVTLVDGVYTHDDGTKVVEKSFMVVVEKMLTDEFTALADEFGKESILYVTSNDQGFLMDSDGRCESIGILRMVDSAIGEDAYTIVNGKVWVVK